MKELIISNFHQLHFSFSLIKLSTKLKYKFPNTSPKTIRMGIKEKKKKKTKTHFSRVGQTR
jgi:rRNA maturation protein Rpf1